MPIRKIRNRKDYRKIRYEVYLSVSLVTQRVHTHVSVHTCMHRHPYIHTFFATTI